MAQSATKAQRRKTLKDDAVNLPNLLTMGRIAAIPLVLWLMALDTRESGSIITTMKAMDSSKTMWTVTEQLTL